MYSLGTCFFLKYLLPSKSKSKNSKILKVTRNLNDFKSAGLFIYTFQLNYENMLDIPADLKSLKFRVTLRIVLFYDFDFEGSKYLRKKWFLNCTSRSLTMFNALKIDEGTSRFT